MKRFFVLIFLLIITLGLMMFIGIDDGFTKETIKAMSTGENRQVVVVLPKKYWDTKLKQNIENTLASLVPSLPQEEARFKVLFVDESSFTNGLKTSHTIIEFTLNNKQLVQNLESPERDTWAKNQVVYRISGQYKSVLAFYKLWANYLVDAIEKRTMKRLTNEIRPSKIIQQEIKTTMNVDIQIDKTMSLAKLEKKSHNFIWLQRIRSKRASGLDQEIQQGIFLYTYPYGDKSDFTLKNHLKKRDEFLKKYVQGSKKGTYMTTEYNEAFMPMDTAFYHDKEYVYCVRGLWRMKGALMGGPFVSMAKLDKKHNRIVVAQGYVFAPHFKKLTYLKELEAMLLTLRLNGG